MAYAAASSTQGGGVLVTGSSSGIGRACAVTLAEHGFIVFATVRKPADADALRSLGLNNLIPICPLDLTQPEQIAAAVEVIKNHLQARNIGLYAIVNNAGAGGIAPIELMDVGGFRTELEARLVGPVTLLQALLPEIRQAHGRIVWIATPGLMPIPFVTNIHAADFALNCLARTLQIELKPWHIPSILVRCGGIQTSAPGKSARELKESFERWPADRFALYADRLKHEAEDQSDFDAKRTDPAAVAQVVYTALTALRPKRRYQIGYLSRLGAALEYLPQTWVDAIMERRG
jgi:NAD(P)-dependent dehydrogenase (short-subunit alcohol dehydrogenase family)